jgi:hypothetical protein
MQIDSTNNSDTAIEDIELSDPASVDPRGPHAAAMRAAKDGLSQDELLGNCVYNARRLRDELRRQGQVADMIRGAVIPEDADEPTTVEEAINRDDTAIHWWVRIHRPDITPEPLVADLATVMDDLEGQAIFRTAPPERYIPLEIEPPNTDGYASR